MTKGSHDDSDDLDRLLDGQAGDVSSARLRRLADLLRAASAPAGPHELRGEDDATAAFRRARSGPSAGRKAGQVLSVKLVAAAVIVVTAGGAAAAVATGLVPAPRLDTWPPVLTGTSTRAAGSAGPDDRTSTAPAPTLSPPAATSAPDLPGDGSGAPTGAPEPARLCGSYFGLRVSDRARGLAEAAFAPLVSLAGGAGSVDGYCNRLLASTAASAPSGRPSTPTPAGSPSDVGSTPPASSPSASPPPRKTSPPKARKTSPPPEARKTSSRGAAASPSRRAGGSSAPAGAVSSRKASSAPSPRVRDVLSSSVAWPRPGR